MIRIRSILKFCPIILSFVIPGVLFAQKPQRLETGLTIGPRNTGVFVAVRVTEKAKIAGGVSIMRFGTLNVFAQGRIYPFIKDRAKSFTGFTPYISTGIKHSFRSEYTYEDSRKYFDTFILPSQNFWTNEIGLRYNINRDGELEYVENHGKFFHFDISLGISFDSRFGNPEATLQRGDDFDNMMPKIDRFLHRKFGVQLSAHISIVKLKHFKK